MLSSGQEEAPGHELVSYYTLIFTSLGASFFTSLSSLSPKPTAEKTMLANMVCVFLNNAELRSLKPHEKTTTSHSQHTGIS